MLKTRGIFRIIKRGNTYL